MDVREASHEFMRVSQRLPTLYELNEQAEALLARCDAAETPEELDQILDALELNDLLAQDKFEAYAAVIAELTWLAEGRKAAADRLARRAKVPAHAVDRLKQRLLEYLQTTGKDRIETQQFTIRRQLNPPSGEVYDEEAVPAEFKEIRSEVYVNVRAVIAHVKQSGEVVPGVTVSQHEGIRIQ